MQSANTIPSAKTPTLLCLVAIMTLSHLLEFHSEPIRVAGTKRKKKLRGARLKVRSIRWRIAPSWFLFAAQKFLGRNIYRNHRTPESIPQLLQTRSRAKGCAPAAIKINDFAVRRVRFDSFGSCGHNCMYVNPVEGIQARQSDAGYK